MFPAFRCVSTVSTALLSLPFVSVRPLTLWPPQAPDKFNDACRDLIGYFDQLVLIQVPSFTARSLPFHRPFTALSPSFTALSPSFTDRLILIQTKFFGNLSSVS